MHISSTTAPFLAVRILYPSTVPYSVVLYLFQNCLLSLTSSYLLRIKTPHLGRYNNSVGQDIVHHLARAHRPREAHVAHGQGSGAKGEYIGALSGSSVAVKVDQNTNTVANERELVSFFLIQVIILARKMMGLSGVLKILPMISALITMAFVCFP